VKFLRPLIAFAAVWLALPATALTATHHWTQFRATASNNAVIGGDLKARWEVKTDGRISASPTFANGTLFIGTNSGTLYAIRAKDGRVLWKHHVANALMSAPLVYRGTIIAGEGNEDTPNPQGGAPAHVGTGESALIAFDEATGALRWRTLVRGSAMPTPAIVAGVLVHHDGSGRITGMDPATGHVLYERNVHSVASMSAALRVGKRVFVTAGVLHNAVLKVDAPTGRVIWRSNPFPSNASGIGDCPLAADEQRLYGEYVVPDIGAQTAVGGIVHEHAYALDLQTGKLVWDMPLQSGPLPMRNEAGIPVVHDGVVYAGGAAAPWVNALDAKTGRVIWRKEIYGPVKSAFTVKKGVLYFGDLGGYLWALNARSGARIGVKSMPTSFNVGSPIIVGKTLVIGSFTGSVYAVPLPEIRESGR
jgi:outer membrane protein assembly factor BamB